MRTRCTCLVFAAALLAVLVVEARPATGEPVSTRITGGVFQYTVARGDTWRSIGARFGVDARTLAADNGVSASAGLKAGRRLRIDNRHVVPSALAGGLVINVPQRMLFVDGPALVAFPVAVGRSSWPTPTVPFTVVRLDRNPTWNVPISIQEEARQLGKPLPAVVEPGPDNPLGQFRIKLSIGSVAIHGTNAPASVYAAATHGCVRLHPDDVASLFAQVTVGTPGAFVYEPVLVAVVDDEVFVEAHADVYHQRDGDGLAGVRDATAALDLEQRIDWTAVAQVLELRAGIARNVTAGKPLR